MVQNQVPKEYNVHDAMTAVLTALESGEEGQCCDGLAEMRQQFDRNTARSEHPETVTTLMDGAAAAAQNGQRRIEGFFVLAAQSAALAGARQGHPKVMDQFGIALQKHEATLLPALVEGQRSWLKQQSRKRKKHGKRTTPAL